jgi:hypothetical protein
LPVFERNQPGGEFVGAKDLHVGQSLPT